MIDAVFGFSAQRLAKRRTLALVGSSVCALLVAGLLLNERGAEHGVALVTLTPTHSTAHVVGVRAFLLVVLMWQTMMTAMMLPVVLPWISMFDVIAGATSSMYSRFYRSIGFFSGYFGAWLLYSLGAAVLQLSLQQSGWLDVDAKLNSAVAGGVLLVAGCFQFTPLKRACLTHCRSPLSYFLSRWHDGPSRAWRIGLEHGLFCVGCCWALMAVGFAAGLMNLMWMAVLTAIVAAEQLLPWGEWVGRACGLALAGWGLRLLLV